MTGPVLLTRAQDDAERSAGRLAGRGIESLVAPVIRIVPVASPPPDAAVGGVIVTSRHAVPALAAHWRDLEQHLFFAVGERTAVALREAGFTRITVGEGTGAALAVLISERLAPGARLLHAAGRDRRTEPAASLATSGFVLTPWIVYVAEAETRLPDAAASALADGRLAAALHYSRRTLGILLDLATNAGLSSALLGLRHACLSQEMAADLMALGASDVNVARRPDEEALFDALAGRPHRPIGRARPRHNRDAKSGTKSQRQASIPHGIPPVTDQPRDAASKPPEGPGDALPDAAATDPDAEPAAAASSRDSVRVFTGSDLPEPGSAEAISSIEDPTPKIEDDTPAAASAEPAGAGEAVAAPVRPASLGVPALLGSGLLGGIVGAGLLYGAEALWRQPSERVNDRLAQLEQRAGAMPSQDAIAANERRIAGLDSNLKALDERVRSTRELAEASSKRAEEAANRPAPTPDPAQAATLAQAGTRLGALERLLAERTEAAAGERSSVERRLADQDQRLAGLARQLAEINPQRLEAGLRLIASERIAAALREGQPLGAYLPILERLKAEAPSLSALQPYTTQPPPSAAALAREFKPLADRIRAEQQPASASDWSGRLLNLADQVVTIRQTAPASGGDPQSAVTRIESALASGALAEAAAAWDILPAPAKAASQAWADSLKRRVAADAAARQLSAQAAAAFDAATR